MTARRLWQWMRSDPRHLVTAITTPLSAWEAFSQVRWQREHGYGALSLGGALAYARARPVRFGYGVGLSVLPTLVDQVDRRRRQVSAEGDPERAPERSTRPGAEE